MMAAMMLPVMSVTWMSVLAALVFVQKLVPEHQIVDAPGAGDRRSRNRDRLRVSIGARAQPTDVKGARG
jgi:hypothetical protein